MVFSCPKRGLYFGFRLAGATHKEAEPVQSARYTQRAGANQRPGGWWYHPARRSRTGTDEMRNHRIR